MSKSRSRKVNNIITEGGVGFSLWRLAMPMMAGALLQDLFSIVDLFFVGRLGYIAIAAISISGVILAVLLVLAIGISSGVTALVAHFTGKKDYTSADNVLFQSVVLCVICSLIMALLGFFGTEGLLRLFGATPEIIPAAAGYLKISFIWSIFIFLFIAFNQALHGSGDAITPLKILILANIINIVLDPLLIFGIGFFPRMEVAGSALATVISRAIGVVILLRHFLFGHSSLHFHRSIFRINLRLMGRMLKIGFFASFEVLLRQFSLLMLLRLITSFGAASVAAYGIAIRFRMAVMMIGFGMGVASSVLIGQNMGAGKPARAAQSGWAALKYYEFMIAPIAIIFFIFSPQIIGAFSNNPEVLKIGTDFLRYIAVTMPFLAAALILGRGMSGAGDTRAPAIMTGVIQLGIRVPLAYALVFLFGFGINGVWLGINVSDIFQGLTMIWYFRKGSWKNRYHEHRSILEQETSIPI